MPEGIYDLIARVDGTSLIDTKDLLAYQAIELTLYAEGKEALTLRAPLDMTRADYYYVLGFWSDLWHKRVRITVQALEEA